MKIYHSLIGKKFDRLTVKEHLQNKRLRVLCICGNTKIVRRCDVVTGRTTSCGCKLKESKTKIHGLSKTSIYKVWASMKSRCHNHKNKQYFRYGGRGIKVCKRWLHSFETFFADMGNRPSDRHTIERLNNDKGYKPSNCVWATYKEQANNNRRNRLIKVENKCFTLAQASRKFHKSYSMLKNRLNNGWSDVQTLFTPKGISYGKLTPAQVLRIRKIYKSKNISQHKLANQFGVTQGTIHNIITYKLWRHV